MNSKTIVQIHKDDKMLMRKRNLFYVATTCIYLHLYGLKFQKGSLSLELYVQTKLENIGLSLVIIKEYAVHKQF